MEFSEGVKEFQETFRALSAARRYEYRFPNDVLHASDFRLFYWYSILMVAFLTSVMLFGLLAKEFIYYWKIELVLCLNLVIDQLYFLRIPQIPVPKRNQSPPTKKRTRSDEDETKLVATM